MKSKTIIKRACEMEPGDIFRMAMASPEFVVLRIEDGKIKYANRQSGSSVCNPYEMGAKSRAFVEIMPDEN